MAGSTTTNRYAQPALIGGVVMGVLSGLPIVSAGNLCCCMWVIGGGMIAAYILQQNESTPITAGDGAIVGLLAGLVGAFVYLIVSIPVTLMVAPFERMFMERLRDQWGDMPPEFRSFAERAAGGGIRLFLGFIAYLFFGSAFSTIGGLIGHAIFQKKLPPATPPTA
ncbi:MAG TPA: hypothetical protein VFA59_20825 [Vicinamibacterales bacterium]|nr:hypothetical protein [Vicinamibacterales bacterium]